MATGTWLNYIIKSTYVYIAVATFVVTMTTWPKNNWKVSRGESFEWKQ